MDEWLGYLVEKKAAYGDRFEEFLQFLESKVQDLLDDAFERAQLREAVHAIVHHDTFIKVKVRAMLSSERRY